MKNERVYELLNDIPDMELYSGDIYNGEYWCKIFMKKFRDEGDTDNCYRLMSLSTRNLYYLAMDFISDCFNVDFEVRELAGAKVIKPKNHYKIKLGCLISERLVLLSNIEKCKHLFSSEKQNTLEAYRNTLASIEYIVKHNEFRKEEMESIIDTYTYILERYGKAFEDLKNNYRANKERG